MVLTRSWEKAQPMSGVGFMVDSSSHKHCVQRCSRSTSKVTACIHFTRISFWAATRTNPCATRSTGFVMVEVFPRDGLSLGKVEERS
ncbi:uncharacterized protein METZ01_LOCUS20165 [marine metagenome]|uniref:Uncharacterized protein n=1 Tax=marine metagenome TaxID=408172 RepID=A0A381PJY0_9ZZZZ